MPDPTPKSTVDEIRERFDQQVERFSSLETGQRAAMDSVEALEQIAHGASIACPHAADLLDVGCGAGNWSLKLHHRLPNLRATLIDLSLPMLDRAEQRLKTAGMAVGRTMQTDVRYVRFEPASFDLIVAGSVLHHLRDEQEWRDTFASFRRWLRPGGSVWIYDLIDHETVAARTVAAARYGSYLEFAGGAPHREAVFAYIEKEDTPRPLTWQLDRLREAGFAAVDVLHKHGPFAAYAAFVDG